MPAHLAATAMLSSSCPLRPACCSIDEARKARQAGADALLVKWELVQQHVGEEGQLAELLEQLRYATSGDD